VIGSVENVKRAVEVAEQVHERGHHPYIPHLTHYQHKILQEIRPGYVPTYERWLEYDYMILERCDAILRYAHSPGADLEWKKAGELGLLRYEYPNELPPADDIAGMRQACLHTALERIALMYAKNQDYSRGTACNIATTGMLGIAVRLIDKAMRLFNIVQDGSHVTDETIEDTLKDAANYADIGLMLYRGQWGLPWMERK